MGALGECVMQDAVCAGCTHGRCNEQSRPAAAHSASSPPPPACSYYQNQRCKQGSQSRWLGLPREQARERGGYVSTMHLTAGPGAGGCADQLVAFSFRIWRLWCLWT